MTDRLPAGFVLVRTTAEFDELTVPAGLLRDHRVAADLWGRLVVVSGSLRFGFDDQPATLVAGPCSVVIPPERLHHVEVIGPVRFMVEFYRRPVTVTT